MRNASKDKHIHTQQAPNTPVSGLEGSATATVSRSGRMEPAMKATGKIIELTASANSLTSMAMFTKETGSMTRQTDREFTFM